jgi:ketosteroid isomerase-like protein
MTSADSAADHRIRAFFATYTAAFTALDTAAIIDHFHFPAQITTETAGYVFATRSDMVQDMSGFVAFYADQGFERAVLADLQVQELSPAFALAHVNWHLKHKDGSDLVRVHTTYILRLTEAKPAIIGILAHDEDTQWKNKQ